MGEDEDIVVVSFSMRDKAPADDLVKFLESGYSFILDADVTPMNSVMVHTKFLLS